MIRVPIIKVVDKELGCSHIVGFDKSDVLSIKNNSIIYENLQNGCSTEDVYEFEKAKESLDELGVYAGIEFVSLEEFFELAIANIDGDKHLLDKLLTYKAEIFDLQSEINDMINNRKYA